MCVVDFRPWYHDAVYSYLETLSLLPCIILLLLYCNHKCIIINTTAIDVIITPVVTSMTHNFIHINSFIVIVVI